MNWGRVRKTEGTPAPSAAGALGLSTGEAAPAGEHAAGVTPSPTTGATPATKRPEPPVASPVPSAAPDDPSDQLVCHACGNVHSVIERKQTLVCLHCGYTRERSDP
jgi:hypothetical protein